VRTWHTQPFAQGGQRRQITSMGRTRRYAGQFANLFKGQAAPEMSDENLTLFDGQPLQRRRGDRAIESRRIRRREPTGHSLGGGGFVTATPALRSRRGQRAVADDSIEPAD